MLYLNFDYPEDSEYWDSIYSDGVLNPKSWIDAAAELACTLNYLRAPAIDFFKATSSVTVGQTLPIEKRVHGCYLMLAGFMVENLLKAIIAKKASSQSAVEPAFLLKEIKTHNLLKLAAKAEVPVTDYGRELLQRLTYFSTWAGRYPVPIYVDDLKPQAISGANPNNLKEDLHNTRRSVS